MLPKATSSEEITTRRNKDVDTIFFFKRKDLDKIYYNMAIFAIKVHVVEQMQISDENALSG